MTTRDLEGVTFSEDLPDPQSYRHRIYGILLLALCMQTWQNASMSVQITIRHVPDKLRDELATRAAAKKQSMQEYLLAELERLAARPSVDQWLQDVRARKQASPKRIFAEAILTQRDADRK